MRSIESSVVRGIKKEKSIVYEDLNNYTSRLTTIRVILTGGYVINGVAYVSMQCT